MIADTGIAEWETTFLNPLTANCVEGVDHPQSVGCYSRHSENSKGCSWRCCADGGANRLYDLLGEARGCGICKSSFIYPTVQVLMKWSNQG
ncbi:hypothetical protein V8E55_004022 [Tylopilus felleus]